MIGHLDQQLWTATITVLAPHPRHRHRVALDSVGLQSLPMMGIHFQYIVYRYWLDISVVVNGFAHGLAYLLI